MLPLIHSLTDIRMILPDIGAPSTEYFYEKLLISNLQSFVKTELSLFVLKMAALCWALASLPFVGF